MTNPVFSIETQDIEGDVVTFGKMFTIKKTADSVAAALNEGVVEGENAWEVIENPVDDSDDDAYLPVIARHVHFNWMTARYSVTLQASATAVVSSIPLPETKITEPTANWPHYGAVAYGRTIAEAEEKAAQLVVELTEKELAAIGPKS